MILVQADPAADQLAKHQEAAQQFVGQLYNQMLQSGMAENLAQIEAQLIFEHYCRMLQMQMPEVMAQSHAHFMAEMLKIAGDLFGQEQGVQVPNTDKLIPYDQGMLQQGLFLFAEGLFHGIMKSLELQIPPDLSNQLLQGLAQEIYTRSKEMIITTLGQENTPDIQISPDQQRQWIYQASESYLSYLLSEHEKQHGPLQPAGATHEQPIDGPAAVSDELLPKNEPAADERLEEHQLSQDPQALHDAPESVHHRADAQHTHHEKYAALALFLGTLQPDHRHVILQRFTPQELQLIQHYQDFDIVASNLNLASVEQHLQSFKKLMHQVVQQQQTKAAQHLSDLPERIPVKIILNSLGQERPLFRKRLFHFYGETPPDAESDDSLDAFFKHELIRRNPSAITEKILPKAVEAAFCQFMIQKFS